MTGIVVAFAYLRNTKVISASWTTVLSAAGVLMLAVGTILQKLHPWPFQSAINYLPGAALLIYARARGRGRVASHLSLQSMELLGMASNSFYLIHMPVIRCVRGVFRHLHIDSPPAGLIVLEVMAAFLIAQVCVIILFRRVEVPAHRALKRHGGRFRESR